MRISGVTLEVRSLGEAAGFHEEVLGLAVAREPGAAHVRVGSTTLTLRENPDMLGVHHLAFTIPANKFAEAKAWVAARTGLLAKDGEDEFDYPVWNARSVYFDGPDRSVLELIVRRDLGNPTEGEFTSDDLLSVSEVGVAVPDVLATAAELASRAGVEPYGLEPRDRFAPVGTIDGLVILVPPGRTWFPAEGRLSAEPRIRIEAVGGHPGEYPLGSGSVLALRPA